jgi:hypothetical protein
MNRNMKDLIVNENISSYLYMFHMCFRQTIFMFRQYKPMKKKKTTIVKSWPKKFVVATLAFSLRPRQGFAKE